MLVPIILYTRRNCPLCEEAERSLTELAARFPLSIEMRDVDATSAWQQSFGQEVPVVFLAETKLFRFRIDEALFENAALAYLESGDDGDHT
jgi:glutaredoxin